MEPYRHSKMKEMSGEYSQTPQEIINSLFRMAQLTWRDIRAMAQILFTEVEVESILNEARNEVFLAYRNANNNIPAQIYLVFPWTADPGWDPNDTRQMPVHYGGGYAIAVF